MQTTTTMVMRPVGSLIPYARNARQHSEEQIVKLRASLREFGFVAPLLIDGQNNVLAGDGRLQAAKAEELKEVPCVLVEHLTDTQRRAYILVDNRLAEQASWDNDLVSLELQELQDAGFDLDLTGFDDRDIILDASTDVAEDDFNPEPPEEPSARRGQIYQLGRHRLMCGDATSPEDVANLMDGCKAELLLTDPPYNVGLYADATPKAVRSRKLRNDDRQIKNDNWKSEEDFAAFLASAFALSFEQLSEGAAFYIWFSANHSTSFYQACSKYGVEVRQQLVWVKNAFVLGRQDYQWQHEPCLYGWTKGKAHLWASDRKQSTVLMFDRPTRSEAHPTMKPVKMMAYLMCNSTHPSALVADFFAGSGSTLIAAEQTDRTSFNMEIDPRYVDVIIARWEALTGQRAVLIE